MPKDSDTKRELDDNNDNLVKALESIKTLLATSEDKLNKARESIDQASSFTLRADDRDIPVLDDIVVAGDELDQTEMIDLNQTIADTTEHADLIIQQLDEVEEIELELAPAPELVPGPEPKSEPVPKPEPESSQLPTAPEPTGPDPAAIAQLQQELESEMQTKLKAYTAQLEQELKERIAAFIALHTDN